MPYKNLNIGTENIRSHKIIIINEKSHLKTKKFKWESLSIYAKCKNINVFLNGIVLVWFEMLKISVLYGDWYKLW